MMSDKYLVNCTKVWWCPACVKVKDTTLDDPRNGVKIAGAPKTMTYLASGGNTLT